ncbi:MAG: hypothetical protein V4527_15020 [Pseudomonadota bacterium]
MRLSGIVFTSLTASLFATAAMAQAAGGSMSGPSMSGPSMSGPAMSGPAMKGGGMQMNSMGGMGIFSKENMAMMIVDREKATKGMTQEQAAAARKDEMAKHGSETPAETQARKAMYDSEWLKLTAAEKTDALAKLDTQMKARGMMAAPPAAK